MAASTECATGSQLFSSGRGSGAGSKPRSSARRADGGRPRRRRARAPQGRRREGAARPTSPAHPGADPLRPAAGRPIPPTSARWRCEAPASRRTASPDGAGARPPRAALRPACRRTARFVRVTRASSPITRVSATSSSATSARSRPSPDPKSRLASSSCASASRNASRVDRTSQAGAVSVCSRSRLSSISSHRPRSRPRPRARRRHRTRATPAARRAPPRTGSGSWRIGTTTSPASCSRLHEACLAVGLLLPEDVGEAREPRVDLGRRSHGERGQLAHVIGQRWWRRRDVRARVVERGRARRRSRRLRWRVDLGRLHDVRGGRRVAGVGGPGLCEDRRRRRRGAGIGRDVGAWRGQVRGFREDQLVGQRIGIGWSGLVEDRRSCGRRVRLGSHLGKRRVEDRGPHRRRG